MEVFESNVFVLVDFWVFWCGFCCVIGLIIEELVEEFDGEFKVGKFNVDDSVVIVC